MQLTVACLLPGALTEYRIFPEGPTLRARPKLDGLHQVFCPSDTVRSQPACLYRGQSLCCDVCQAPDLPELSFPPPSWGSESLHALSFPLFNVLSMLD